PAAHSAVCLRAMAREPGQRYVSMAELATALASLAQSDPGTFWGRFWRWAAYAAGAALLLLNAVLLLYPRRPRPPGPDGQRSEGTPPIEDVGKGEKKPPTNAAFVTPVEDQCLRGHAKGIVGLALADGGKRVISVDADRYVWQWGLEQRPPAGKQI